MPTPTIPAGNLFMNATTYTGNGATQTITNGAAGASFQPDLVWGKARSAATSNEFYDSIRGVSKSLLSNTTGAENNWAPYGVTAFNTNGFSVNDIASNGYGINETGVTYVGWQWKAGGTAVSNTAGSLTSQVSANTTSGFSVVTYTGNGTIGATVGHGLGVAPSMFIVKQRSSAGESWATYHISIGATKYLDLNGTAAASTSISRWNNTAPTTTVFSLYNDTATNGNSSTYVAYCWAPIAGYSAFGSYVGNGSSNGPFVYLGFRPKFVMIKISSGTVDSWFLLDTSRDTYNVAGLDLIANDSYSETDDRPVLDFLSNGIKMRCTYNGLNASGSTYIYAAFAETPLKFSNAR